MAGKSYKGVQRTMRLEVALDSFYSDIESLAEEVREIVDNAGDNLANTSRIQTFEATADTLENLSRPTDPSLPEALKTMEITVMEAMPRSRRQNISRAVRCENATAYGRVAVDSVREWCDEVEQTDQSPGDDTLTELREWCDEIEDHLSEAESAEFPGMYG